MRRIITVVLTIQTLLIGTLRAQKTEIDSLKNLVSIQGEDSVKVNLYLELGKKLIESNSIQANFYLSEAINLSNKIDYPKGIAEGNYLFAKYYSLHNKPYSARNSINKAMKIYTQITDYKSIAYSYVMMATICRRDNNFDSCLYYNKKALSIRDSIKDDYGSALSHLFLSDLYNLLGKNGLALQHGKEALSFFKKENYFDKTWSTVNLLGVIYNDLGKYDLALEKYLSALEINLKTDDKEGAVYLYNNIAVIYDYMSKPKMAVEYYMKAFEIVKAKDDKEGEALIYNNIAEAEAQLGDTTKAIAYLYKSISLNLELDNSCDLSYNYEGLGSLFVGKNILDSAHIYLNNAIKLGEICQDKTLLASAYKNLGILYKKKKDNKKAIQYLNKAISIAEESGLRNEIKLISLELSKYYESMGYLKKALHFHKVFQETKDSIFNSKSSENISRMTFQFEFNKEKRLLELESEKESLKMEEELEREEENRNTMLIILILAFILVATLSRAYYLIAIRNKKLTSLNEEKNTLIGVVAHDLRSPLNNMRSLIPIIINGKDPLTKDQSHYLNLFDQSTTRMSEMINRVLDINAIEDRKINLKLESCDIKEILDSTIQSFDAPLSKKKIIVFKNYQSELSHKVKVDKNYLFQVFENIISNAIKFSKEGTKLYLSIKQEDEHVIVGIKDQGQGIKEEEINLLFKRYQKLSAKPTANESSTGLGLSNAKKYVDAMNGRIWCESTVGDGATFYISFKVYKEPTPFILD